MHINNCDESVEYFYTHTSVVALILKFSVSSFCFFIFVFPVYIQAEPINHKSEIEELKVLILQQQKANEKQMQIINGQGQQIQKLISQVKELSKNQNADKASVQAATSSANKQKASSTATAITPVAKNLPTTPPKANQTTIIAQNKASKDQPPQPIKPVGQKPPKPKEVRPPEIPRLSDTVGGVLTRKGNLVIEPSVQYFFSDTNRLFLDAFTFLPGIAIGLIDVREIKRHAVMANLTFRYGITDKFEFDFKVPYVYRSDEQRSRAVNIGAANDEIFNATGNSIGDLELTTRYQLNNGSGGWPIFVGNFITTIPTGKSPFDVEFIESEVIPGAVFPTELATGTGFYSFQPSVTALYPTDPAVFFGGLSYSYNLRTHEDIGVFDPGDTLGLSFGLGVSLNERTSFSLGYSHRHVFNSRLNNNTIDGSSADVGQLLIGYSYKFSKRTLLNLSLGIGVTEDSPNLKLDFRIPMTFDVASQFYK